KKSYEFTLFLYYIDILDSERSDECIDFTMMYVFLFIFLFLCLSPRFGAVKMLRFLSSASFLIGNFQKRQEKI
ncbi:Uncharacterized protein FWK35_00031826, partial [Aphis craccivora]